MSNNRELVLVGHNSISLQIEQILISDLKPNPSNARVHPDKQIAMLARNIDTFGFLVPCLIDEDNRLLTGGARVMAAQRLAMTAIPAVRIGHLNDAEKRAFVIADNKLAESAVWDADVLRSELQFLSNLNINFDFSIIGFETAEIDIMLNNAIDPSDDAQHEKHDGPSVTQSGDLWIAGPHRILCGDALASASYGALLGNARAQLVFTDPPYNVSMKDVGGAGRIQHREFAMASGEMTSDEFTLFLTTVAHNLALHSVDGSLHYICMDWRHCKEIIAAGTSAYSELKNICVWRKTNAGMGSLYRSQYELIFLYQNGTAPHINNINLGTHGRNRSNVWDYGGINSFGRDRDKLLAMHPTVKPVALIADVIKDASHRGSIVLDAFGGSGSTLIAAEKTRRRAALIEIDPHYVDIAVRRWQALTGQDAICANTGMTFVERGVTAITSDGVSSADIKGPDDGHS
ncbi:MAG: ParB N-terminal domain-containing protein [Afipia sp.]|nr:ParB N-terminal domain-containing protein [Afipia sp.]